MGIVVVTANNLGVREKYLSEGLWRDEMWLMDMWLMVT